MAPLGGRSQDHGFAASSEGGQGGAVESAPDSGVGPCLPSHFCKSLPPLGTGLPVCGERHGWAQCVLWSPR